MATNRTRKAPVEVVDEAPTNEVILRGMSDEIEGQAFDALADAYEEADKEWHEADKKERSASHDKKVAAVWMARIAYRAASHEAVKTARYPYNITGAARVLKRPVATLRPYAMAGELLGKADRAGLLSAPNADDIKIVDDFFEAGVREQQRQKRVKEREEKKALKAAKLELDALKKNGEGSSPSQAPAQDQAPATDGKAPEAPAKADQAPATPSGTEAPAKAPAADVPNPLKADVKATARQLVAQVKLLREAKEWRDVASEVSAILAEVYPALKS